MQSIKLKKNFSSTLYPYIMLLYVMAVANYAYTSWLNRKDSKEATKVYRQAKGELEEAIHVWEKVHEERLALDSLIRNYTNRYSYDTLP